MTTTPSLAADLTWGATWPSADVFTHLATERRVIPVVRRLLAELDIPVSR